jgi:Holliday junction resolvase RusA-like endonuclease
VEEESQRGSVLSAASIDSSAARRRRAGTSGLQLQKSTPKKVAAFNGDHTSKPDLSNLIKHTEDALTEANMWADDNQIDTMTAQKFRCPRGEQRVEVVISW